MTNNPKTGKIIGLLKTKSILKQKIFDNTYETFTLLKEVLAETAEEFNPPLTEFDKRVTVEFTNRDRKSTRLNSSH